MKLSDESVQKALLTLANSPKVKRVEVVGEMAKNGENPTLDLIVNVPVQLYKQYVKRVQPWVASSSNPDMPSQARFEITMELLGLGPRSTFYELRLQPGLYMLPLAWQGNLSILQKDLSDVDLELLEQLASEAKLLEIVTKTVVVHTVQFA